MKWKQGESEGMKKNIDIGAFVVSVFSLVVGFMLLGYFNQEKIVNIKYDLLVAEYEDELNAYDESFDAYLKAYEQYELDLCRYNEAVEAAANKNEIPENGIIKVKANYSIDTSDNNSVGNEWGYILKINGSDLTYSPAIFSINAHDPFTICVEIEEYDEANSDYGFTKEVVHYTNEEILAGIGKDITVNVEEGDGRYTGHVAYIKVHIDIIREIEQIYIPNKPQKPVDDVMAKPVEPRRESVNVDVFDLIKDSKMILVYTVIASAIMVVLFILFLKKHWISK